MRPKGYKDARKRTLTRENIFANTTKQGECVIWMGARTRWGYGQCGTACRGVHRRSFELFNGPIPPGMFVLHRCDNPPCINPEHLFLGTYADNTRDMIAKGRARFWGRRAPANLNS